MFSTGDALYPYLDYQAQGSVFVNGGAGQLPLAYKLTPGVQRATSRLLQIAEPTVIIVVEWAGRRNNAKPEPPYTSVDSDFLLVSAGGKCAGPTKDSQGNDILAASGFFVLVTNARPEGIKMPALWLPYDGRYNTPTPLYLYSTEDLGF